jgi:hypothetical protein
MNMVHDRIVTLEEESVSDLIKDLRDETVIMMRQQIELAKSETSEKFSRTINNTFSLATGGIVLYTGALFILTSLTFLGFVGLIAAGVAPGIAMWLMPLITGVVVAAIGGFMVSKAINTLKHTPIVPERMVNTLKEDQKWIRRKL